jgi:CheY-like chemotaxis protein
MIKTNKAAVIILYFMSWFVSGKLSAMERFPVLVFGENDADNQQKINDANAFCDTHKKNIIVIIDDEQTTLMILARLLASNYPVITVRFAKDFVKILRDKKINNLVSCTKLVVMDYHMKELNGGEAMKLIKKEQLLTFSSNGDVMEVLAVLNTTDPDVCTDEFELKLSKKNDVNEICQKALESPRKRSDN